MAIMFLEVHVFALYGLPVRVQGEEGSESRDKLLGDALAIGILTILHEGICSIILLLGHHGMLDGSYLSKALVQL
eukprot:1158720-Pelagomonas_calceolata.AAC.1